MKHIPFILCLLIASFGAQAQIAVGIDAQPFLGYAGNVLSGSAGAPVWQGAQGIPLGIDIAQYRQDTDTWLRYRLAMRYQRSQQRMRVSQLDNELNPVPGAFVEDRLKSEQVYLHLGLEREKWVGDNHSIKGIWGRGIELSTSRSFSETEIENPFESYVGDTLWSDSGHDFAARLYISTGVVYQPLPDLFLSARMDWGLSTQFAPDHSVRAVRPINGSVVLEQTTVTAGHSSFGLDTYMRPRLVLSFYF